MPGGGTHLRRMQTEQIWTGVDVTKIVIILTGVDFTKSLDYSLISSEDELLVQT